MSSVDANKLNGWASSPTIPEATTTYVPFSANSNGNSAITSPPAGAMPTVNEVGRINTGVAVLYSKLSIASPPFTYISTVGSAEL